MKDTIDALELLKSQHDEVDELFSQIEASDDGEEKLELFQELADKLAAHATIEEKLFYPSVMSDNTEDKLIESTEEHLQMKRLLADMLEMEPSDDHFTAKLNVLKEEVRHHARDEEEGKLFKQVRRMMDKDELAALGNELMAMFEQLMQQEPRMKVPSQTGEAADLQAPMY